METNPLPVASSDETARKICQQQERELSILKAIIQMTSSSRSLQEALESALEMILSVVDSATGWICLIGADNSCSAFVGYRGLCFDGAGGNARHCLAQCVCGRVHRTGKTVMVRHLSQSCPLKVDPQILEPEITGHVSVPLSINTRIVGQLNVAFANSTQADRMNVELLKTISPHLAVAVENARLWDEVQKKEALRKELLKRVVLAQEEERRRISRELHDELGQELTSLLVRLQVLENLDGHPSGGDVIRELKETTSRMLEGIHDLALELRPTSLDDLGLAPALAQYTRSCPSYLGIEVDFEAIGIRDDRFPREIETTLYRIVQESLTNVARHSGAKKASVLLKRDEGKIAVIIEDTGVGFDPKENLSSPAKKNRLGIYGMEERVSLVGGSLAIESSPGNGTIVYIEIPISAGAGL